MERSIADVHNLERKKQVKANIEEHKSGNNAIFTNQQNKDELKWFINHSDEYVILKDIFEDKNLDMCLIYLRLMNSNTAFKILYSNDFASMKDYCIIYCLLKLMNNKNNLKKIYQNTLTLKFMSVKLSKRFLQKMRKINLKVEKLEPEFQDAILKSILDLRKKLDNNMDVLGIIMKDFVRNKTSADKFRNRLQLLINVLEFYLKVEKHHDNNEEQANNLEGWEPFLEGEEAYAEKLFEKFQINEKFIDDKSSDLKSSRNPIDFTNEIKSPLKISSKSKSKSSSNP